MDSIKKDRFRRIPGVWFLILAAALGIFLLVFGSRNRSEKSDAVETGFATDPTEEIAAYTEMLEAKIAALCNGVNGVSGARVAVTLSSGYEYVYAKDSSQSVNGDATKGETHYLTIGNGSSEAVVYLSEKLPEIQGIGVVCRGGSIPEIRKELTDLLSAAFGVPSNRIYIAEGG